MFEVWGAKCSRAPGVGKLTENPSSLSYAETMIAMPFESRTAPPVFEERRRARVVLEELIKDALDSRGPSFVLFSGGRDSSAVLAIASHVARREGLPLPIPVTARYPHSPETDETAWQQMVLNHLKLSNAHVLEFDGEQRVLGEAARLGMSRLGVLWPASLHVKGAILSHLGPGSLMTGEGGDFVIDGLRMGELRLPIHRHRPRRQELRRALAAGAPRTLGFKRSRGGGNFLTARARPVYESALKRNDSKRFLWHRQVRHMFDAPYVIVAEAGSDLVISDSGLCQHRLFTHPRFVDALAREGGAFGFGGRTQTFRHLVGDLLPEAVIGRTSKAWFNSTRWGPDEDQFARTWDGTGIDPEWVDHDALRNEWLSPGRSSAAEFLIQVAWFAKQGIRPATRTSREDVAS